MVCDVVRVVVVVVGVPKVVVREVEYKVDVVVGVPQLVVVGTPFTVV